MYVNVTLVKWKEAGKKISPPGQLYLAGGRRRKETCSTDRDNLYLLAMKKQDGKAMPLAAVMSYAHAKAHIITGNYLQLFYCFQPTKLLLAA